MLRDGRNHQSILQGTPAGTSDTRNYPRRLRLLPQQ